LSADIDRIKVLTDPARGSEVNIPCGRCGGGNIALAGGSCDWAVQKMNVILK
jgi:hypothetical protein